MAIKSLKSVLRFWQEIFFVVPIVLALAALAKAVILGHTMNGVDILLVSIFAPLLFCLIGQFFWRSKALGNVLFVLLEILSIIVVLMALYAIGRTNSATITVQVIIMLIYGIAGIFTAFTMIVPQNKFAPDGFGETVAD